MKLKNLFPTHFRFFLKIYYLKILKIDFLPLPLLRAWNSKILCSKFKIHLRVNFFKSRTAKIDIPHIKHGETTSHQHHFCQRDHGSICYHFSSRLIPFFYFRSQKKFKIIYKTLNSRAILLKIGTLIEPGQENFLMPWLWKYLRTMGQNSIFYEKFLNWIFANFPSF